MIYIAQRGAGVHGSGAGPSRGGEDHQEAGGAAHRHGLPVRTHAPLLILPRQGDFSYDMLSMTSDNTCRLAVPGDDL